mmetsp:Transcript_36691/g.80168  ORF Transcript_36691/g.80168 Transcript_36691/m.80168 type:complete len:225 (+) Transcript_36691:339-1013(+)
MLSLWLSDVTSTTVVATSCQVSPASVDRQTSFNNPDTFISLIPPKSNNSPTLVNTNCASARAMRILSPGLISTWDHKAPRLSLQSQTSPRRWPSLHPPTITTVTPSAATQAECEFLGAHGALGVTLTQCFPRLSVHDQTSDKSIDLSLLPPKSSSMAGMALLTNKHWKSHRGSHSAFAVMHDHSLPISHDDQTSLTMVVVTPPIRITSSTNSSEACLDSRSSLG